MLEPISVSEVTYQIKSALSIPSLQNLAIEGEVSNFVHHTSGHMYFSLKDEDSRIKAVMFRSRNQHLGFIPKNGDTVIAVGSVGVYEPNGDYQLYVDYLFSQGTGELHLAFQKLKEKLEREGLFRKERKLPLPYLPRRIGVITSPTGAAIRDILNVLTRRFPGVHVLIFPASVQGFWAPGELIEAIKKAHDTDVDVLIMARGGGSFEELAAFNDESLARSIANSTIPVVVGVGHETDSTIADFVADLRASTPSEAAELVVCSKQELIKRVFKLKCGIEDSVLRHVLNEERHLKRLTDSPALVRPEQTILRWRQKVDELWTSLNLSQRHSLALKRAQLGQMAGKLDALSPLGTLGRGYAICRDEKGVIVQDSRQVDVGSHVQITLHNGRLFCKVKEREAND